MSDQEKKKFWNDRAENGELAGTNDLNLKKIEISELEKYFSDDLTVLEVGCGNGESAEYFASKFKISIDAIDFAEKMVTVAIERLKLRKDLLGKVSFQVADIREFNTDLKYDLIYCQRSLINLDSWPEQQHAIEKILGWLTPGGRFVMCENSLDGLNQINSYRNALDMEDILPPWHNQYLEEAEVAKVNIAGVKLEEIVSFSSTYYFLSRVVNAALAAQMGESPAYDSPINLLAMNLPPINNAGQTKLWVWKMDL
jgi:ubiquinone/menaquinone biosynthesis C-methylase UbiE